MHDKIDSLIDVRDDRFVDDRLLWDWMLLELARIHDSTPAGARAELALIWTHLQNAAWIGLSVARSDLQRIADLELEAARPSNPEHVGVVLDYALRRLSDETRSEWSAWMAENLPAGSLYSAMARATNMFGKSLRLTGTGLDNQPIDTADWLGDIILVDFWGSWCVPCLTQMPKIAELRNELEPRGFRVLGVAYEDPDRTREYLATRPEYDWPNIAGYLDEDRQGKPYGNLIVEQYGVESFPTYWIIDRDGVVHKGARRADELESQIRSLINRPRD